MVFLDAPHVIGNTELVGHIAQILVVADDTGDVAVELTRLPACQQVVEAVTHFRDEYCHTGALVAVIEREFHLVALGIERGDIVIEFVARNQKAFEFPFYAHKEHAVYLVDILVEVDDVAFVVGDKLGHF